MSAESNLRTLLIGTPAIAALVDQRVRANRAEQGDVRPFVVFTRTATDRTATLTGEVVAVLVTFAIEVWANDQVAAEAVADAIQTAIEAQHHHITDRGTAFDGDLDLDAATLTVDWWDA